MSWRDRYGSEPLPGLPQLGAFLDHRSVRSFAERPVPESVLQGLVAAAQSASTSSNLQLWSIVSVQEPLHREAIAKLCGDQDQVRNAPWFLCFLADHHRLRKAAASEGESAEGLGHVEFLLMATVDAALAAERLVCAAESIGLGVCYIGALRNDPQGVAELLELPQGVFGLFGLCLGYPAEEGGEVKPRLAQKAVWFRETYDPDPDVAEYDGRMRGFYEDQGMRGDRTWSARSGQRVDRHQLSGREVLSHGSRRSAWGRSKHPLVT